MEDLHSEQVAKRADAREITRLQSAEELYFMANERLAMLLYEYGQVEAQLRVCHQLQNFAAQPFSNL